MKKVYLASALISAALLVSCQKQQTDAEKNAEIERRVQERLAAEHQTQQQQQLDQRQSDLDAREKALAEKENATSSLSQPEANTESESDDSDAAVSAPRERGISVGYSTFYNKLEPYGDWIQTGDYGYVFHPREARSSQSWRPYTYGRWVYTDAGWTWISEEPFGWATYHYGRWTRIRGIGWVWVPGNQWAPAWVSWRKSSDYVGWAPLPPEARFDRRTGIQNWSDNYYDVGPDQYCFVASREFGAPRVEQTLLPPERNVVIVNQTTNVTNITYKNTTIVNEGPNYEELRSISREPVERYRLERNSNFNAGAEPPRPEVRGETVVIAAPVIAAPAANERPATVKQTVATAAVDLGWAAIANQDEAKKTREKMKSEAAPPVNAPPKKFAKPSVVGGAPRSNQTATSAPAMTAPSAATVTTATPAPTNTPRRVITAPSATAAPSSTPIATPVSSPIASPTASQRRGRLLVPNTTPSPTHGVPQNAIAPSSTTPNPPVPRETFSAPTAIPMPSRNGGGKGMRKPNVPSPSATAASSPQAAATPSAMPSEPMTRREQKEQKREERREIKRERKQGGAAPTATP